MAFLGDCISHTENFFIFHLPHYDFITQQQLSVDLGLFFARPKVFVYEKCLAGRVSPGLAQLPDT